ncbi:hypothetical protein D3C84_598420 [compost metagenome]
MAEGDTLHAIQRPAVAQGLEQGEGGLLALAAHDDVDGWAVAKNFLPVIGGVYPAIDDGQLWQGLFQQLTQLDHGDVCRARSGVAEHRHRRLRLAHLLGDRRQWQVVQVRIQQRYLEPDVQQWAAHAEQAEWWQVLVGDAAADGGMGRVDQDDLWRCGHSLSLGDEIWRLRSRGIARWRREQVTPSACRQRVRPLAGTIGCTPSAPSILTM